MLLHTFDPLIAEWFARRFAAPTEPQIEGWPLIRAGRDVLISAPTGSGKTLAAFLICIDQLVRQARLGPLPDQTQIVYVSPLKALSNDVHKNLEMPLGEVRDLAAAKGLELAPIRAAVRTGDTTAWERQQMLGQPPHILVTTPESLYILLTAGRGRKMLAHTHTVIVDEIHAVADDKRGAHLALSLARLEHLVRSTGLARPQRIGLSATVSPIEEVAAFLVGGDGSISEEPAAGATHTGSAGVLARPSSTCRLPKVGSSGSTSEEASAGVTHTGSAGVPARPSSLSNSPGSAPAGVPTALAQPEAPAPALPPPAVVSIGRRRTMDLAIEVPRDELSAVATNEMWDEIYDRLAALINEHRTTLVFVNTRRLAERVTHHLAERVGEDSVLAHHGSLSRKLRFQAEDRLKRGQLRAVVATASLELGIDIGTVDLACQVGSPRSIAVSLQRTGRSGHWVGAIPKGRMFATTRDELIECASIVRAMREGQLDRLEIPDAPLDILAQQIVAMSATDEWLEDDLYALVRSCYSYRNLPRKDFDAIIEMLAEGIATGKGRSSAYLHRDRVNGRIKGRRGAGLAAITSGGAIPETAQYAVVAEPEGSIVGTVDEDFAVESMAGDIFLLGTTSWRIRRIEAGRLRVENAHGAPPNIPFWRGEAPGRTRELSQEFSGFRAAIIERAAGNGGRASAVEFAMAEGGLDQRGAEQAVDYVRAGAAALGVLPTWDTVVAERFFDESGGMQLILHAPFGTRINRAWGLSLRKRFCRSFNLELQAAATDNGIVISLSEQHSFPLASVFGFLNTRTVEYLLSQALLAAPFFTARWRWNATRMLAVLRHAGGQRVPPPIQRMRADDLLAAVFPDQAACGENLTGDIRIPDHPLVNETMANCLHEAMDLNGLREILSRIEDGTIRTVAVDTAEPSPFSHEILNSNPYAYLDDAPLEERRARAVQMRRTLSPDEAGEVGALDAAAIAEVERQSWPVVRDADELHDALLTLVALPPVLPQVLPQVETWREFFGTLVAARRATTMRAGIGAAGGPPPNSGRGALPGPLQEVGATTEFWVPAEHLDLARCVYPQASFEPPIAGVSPSSPLPESQEECAALVLRGWLESTGPVRASELSERLAMPRDLVDIALARLEGSGLILRGRFTPLSPDTSPSGDPGSGEPVSSEPVSSEPVSSEPEWCNRRLLARIHRLTLGRLRAEIEPVTSADFMRFLLHWQHLASGTQLHGPDGLLQVLRQLQGLELSAAAWETHILPRRIARYTPELLDRLCLAGEVMWGRLSPHPAFERELQAAAADGNGVGGNGHPRRRAHIRPTRVAPIAFLLREDADWLLATAAREVAGTPAGRGSAPSTAADAQQAKLSSTMADSLSHPARDVLAALQRRGASFFNEILRSTGRLASEVEDGLWELVAAGLVTADGFENLRALINPKRRRGEGRERFARPRHAAGRWALLEHMPREAASPAPDGGPLAGFARQLLRRWGVVFRDLLARETLAPAWRDLLVVLRRMEARGEIRGGRFVAGYMGEQFAMPEAVDLLRTLRRSHKSGEEIHISAADPLNLVGIVLPGVRTGPLTGRSLVLLDGVPQEVMSDK